MIESVQVHHLGEFCRTIPAGVSTFALIFKGLVAKSGDSRVAITGKLRSDSR